MLQYSDMRHKKDTCYGKLLHFKATNVAHPKIQIKANCAVTNKNDSDYISQKKLRRSKATTVAYTRM